MITTTQVYWLTRLDGIGALGIIMTVLGLLVTTFATLVYACCFNALEVDVRRVIRNVLRVSASALTIGIAIDVFVPDTKEMAAILVVPRIANSESLTGVADGIKTLAVEWLEELRPGEGGK